MSGAGHHLVSRHQTKSIRIMIWLVVSVSGGSWVLTILGLIAEGVFISAVHTSVFLSLAVNNCIDGNVQQLLFPKITSYPALYTSHTLYNLLNTSSTTSCVPAFPPKSGDKYFPSTKLPSTAS